MTVEGEEIATASDGLIKARAYDRMGSRLRFHNASIKLILLYDATISSDLQRPAYLSSRPNSMPSVPNDDTLQPKFVNYSFRGWRSSYRYDPISIAR
jgi:hypothetical protein